MSGRILKHPAVLVRYWSLANVGGDQWRATLTLADGSTRGVVTGNDLHDLQMRLQGDPWTVGFVIRHQGIPQIFAPIVIPPEYAEDAA